MTVIPRMRVEQSDQPGFDGATGQGEDARQAVCMLREAAGVRQGDAAE